MTLLAAYAGDIREAMAAARSLGGITYFESLLLLHIGYLFYLSGRADAGAPMPTRTSPPCFRSAWRCAWRATAASLSRPSPTNS